MGGWSRNFISWVYILTKIVGFECWGRGFNPPPQHPHQFEPWRAWLMTRVMLIIWFDPMAGLQTRMTRGWSEVWWHFLIDSAWHLNWPEVRFLPEWVGGKTEARHGNDSDDWNDGNQLEETESFQNQNFTRRSIYIYSPWKDSCRWNLWEEGRIVEFIWTLCVYFI